MLKAGWWSILPPLLSITLALLTGEVYSALFLGVVSGALIFAAASGGSLISAAKTVFDLMSEKISDNAYMLIFLALLWALVSLISRSGGSAAYGKRMEKRLRTKRSAALSAVLLGVLIFIDDGFNCLTVGTVMKPIFDRMKISREKLAYIADATAAPVCILAPVSSWAVAVASEISAQDGFRMFLSAIPYNFYAIAALALLLTVCITGRDFGPMRRAEARAASAPDEPPAAGAPDEPQGRVIDLVLPVALTVVCSVLGMAYVGGFFGGVGFSRAIGENPAAGLTLGTFTGLLAAFVLYTSGRVMKPREFVAGIIEGIGKIVPPVVILILSWTLGGICREKLGAGEFLSGLVSMSALPLAFVPFLIFLLGALMSFSLGSSWGTFGILIPIVMMLCTGDRILIPALGATLAGAVFGDHCSPISDTTILASTGAECEHIRHVSTQMPYALFAAALSAAGYLILGFVML